MNSNFFKNHISLSAVYCEPPNTVISYISRYWPKFLSGKGNALMFNRLRKYCKWHQKQVKIGNDWKYETRLVAWYGPCDYNYSGLQLDKNLNWAPELLDLLHRLIAMTRHEFNSCFCNLYRHGHDMCGWHADVHPQLGRYDLSNLKVFGNFLSTD